MPRQGAARKSRVEEEIETPLKLFCPHCGEELRRTGATQAQSTIGVDAPIPDRSYHIVREEWACSNWHDYWRQTDYDPFDFYR